MFKSVAQKIMRSLGTQPRGAWSARSARKPARGTDVAYDIGRALPHQTFLTVFDVGANIGQSADAFLTQFPQAKIWCFEPSRQTCEQLTARFAQEPRVVVERLAVSSSKGTAALAQTSQTTMFHVARPLGELPRSIKVTGSETVETWTIDEFCAARGIDRIDFLKIDTEGHELEVISGAKRMLAEGRIKCIQCECGLHPENLYHCSLEKIKPALEASGYRLFGVYGQSEERFGDTPNLRRADLLFVCQDVLEANRISLRRKLKRRQRAGAETIRPAARACRALLPGYPGRKA